jgi:hypothetical protein
LFAFINKAGKMSNLPALGCCNVMAQAAERNSTQSMMISAR